MSWGIQEIVGRPENIRQPLVEALDAAAKYYEGQTEYDDVVVVKERLLKMLDEAKLAEGYGLLVQASGSRGSGTSPWLSLQVTTKVVKLA